MLTKFNKVKDPALLRDYAWDNPRCELCWKLDRKQVFDALHIHHIHNAHYRTDELWNIIRLCMGCHDQAHGQAKAEIRALCIEIKQGKSQWDAERAAMCT
jgi:5-methylcytosine-specific restriction endonuclease McrA